MLCRLYRTVQAFSKGYYVRFPEPPSLRLYHVPVYNTRLLILHEAHRSNYAKPTRRRQIKLVVCRQKEGLRVRLGGTWNEPEGFQVSTWSTHRSDKRIPGVVLPLSPPFPISIPLKATEEAHRVGTALHLTEPAISSFCAGSCCRWHLAGSSLS